MKILAQIGSGPSCSRRRVKTDTIPKKSRASGFRCMCGQPVARLGDYCEDWDACQERIDRALDPGVNPITGEPNPARVVTPGWGGR